MLCSSNGGGRAARDIVQFCRLNALKEMAHVEVATHVLWEVPHHFVDYMVLLNVEPELYSEKFRNRRSSKH